MLKRSCGQIDYKILSGTYSRILKSIDDVSMIRSAAGRLAAFCRASQFRPNVSSWHRREDLPDLGLMAIFIIRSDRSFAQDNRCIPYSAALGIGPSYHLAG